MKIHFFDIIIKRWIRVGCVGNQFAIDSKLPDVRYVIILSTMSLPPAVHKVHDFEFCLSIYLLS